MQFSAPHPGAGPDPWGDTPPREVSLLDRVRRAERCECGAQRSLERITQVEPSPAPPARQEAKFGTILRGRCRKVSIPFETDGVLKLASSCSTEAMGRSLSSFSVTSYSLVLRRGEKPAWRETGR